MLEMEDGDQIDCMIQQVGGNVDGDEKAEQKTISIVVKIANAPPLTMKVKESTKMEKIFNAVASQTGLTLPSFPSFSPPWWVILTPVRVLISMTEGSPGAFYFTCHLYAYPQTSSYQLYVHTYSLQTGRNVSDFRFFYDGAKVKKEKTIKEVGMEDGDEMEAMIEQVGGLWWCKEWWRW